MKQEQLRTGLVQLPDQHPLVCISPAIAKKLYDANCKVLNRLPLDPFEEQVLREVNRGLRMLQPDYVGNRPEPQQVVWREDA